MAPVQKLNQEYKSIYDYLNNHGQLSLSTDVNKTFRKSLILSSASYFEHKIQEILMNFIAKKTNNNNLAVSFFRKKAVVMQYHTYFTWGEKDEPDKPGKNANTFLSLFGEEFKKQIALEIKASPVLENSVKSFIEIGHLRNILVHSNFAEFELENKTADDIYTLYTSGLAFIEYIEEKLNSN